MSEGVSAWFSRLQHQLVSGKFLVMHLGPVLHTLNVHFNKALG